jgi:hypothetical protein
MKRLALPLLALALLIGGRLALAQTDYPTPQTFVNSRGAVVQCLNGAGVAVASVGPYPCGATPITASATGTAGSVTATLAAVATKTTYICSFQITSSGATGAAAVAATVTGTITGTMNYVYPQVAVATNNQNSLPIPFNPCIPASGLNVAIAVNLTTGAGTTLTAVSAQGFQL